MRLKNLEHTEMSERVSKERQKRNKNLSETDNGARVSQCSPSTYFRIEMRFNVFMDDCV